jgi:hypothetical protein
MAINPQNKDALMRFTLVAKKIIYDTARMKQFMQMMGSKEGALTAVQTVMGTIDQHRPVPPAIRPLLGVNIYMLIVDVLQDATGKKADPGILQEVIKSILGNTRSQSQQGAQPAQPAQPQGIIQQAGVSA